ncbi:MAG: cell surface protein SprA [Flavobacteriales bacterium]|nr:cell surface protein SprA [Flavobacteriales bacterium]
MDFLFENSVVRFRAIFFVVFFSFLFNVQSQNRISLDTINKTIYIGEFKLKTPTSILSKYIYDEESNLYIYQSKIGDIDYSLPLSLNPDEYRELFKSTFIKNYFNEQLSILQDPNKKEEKKNLLPNLYINSDFFETIFGGNEIELNPQGSIGIDLGARYIKRENPSIPIRNQSNINLDFNQAISLSLNGKIGNKLNVNANYDSQSTFDFQNLLKLDYSPDEDDIIQKIELGNVSMPISGSLINGAQSLFGFKTQLKFGATTIDAVISEQRSQSSTMNANSDGAFNEFSFFPLDYDSNRHFFLAHYFRKNFDRFLETSPYVNSPINITRVEIWITNQSNETDNVRSIIALQDIGESDPDFTRIDDFANDFFNTSNFDSSPSNSLNNFDPELIGQNFLNNNIRTVSGVGNGFSKYSNLILEGTDYTVLENARKLDESEYVLNEKLGFISLNQSLNNDEILAIAFQYTYMGKVYQVGEFSSDANNSGSSVTDSSLILKMLKSNLNDVRQPVFKLMMKNIYNIGSYQVNLEDFKLNIFYNDPSSLNYISPADSDSWPQNLDKLRLLNLFDLDKLDANQNLQEGGDGFFDAVDGVTFLREKGLLIFPTIEPFGSFIFEKLRSSSSEQYNNPNTYNINQKKYVYNELYSKGKTSAEKFIQKNKFNLKGRYKSSQSEGAISTGEFNIPQGSVVVTAGGRMLQEGVDYLVNYQTGDVQILNESLKNSNIPIEISTESNSLYSQQKRRFSGINIEHKFNDKFRIGGSLINLSEKSISRKANYGIEPVNNTIFGMNAIYNSDAPVLTRLVNILPNINTDTKSNISLRTEFAYLKSSKPRSSGYDNSTSVYIDDFEGTQNKIDLRDINSWKLGSVPVGYKGYEFGNNDLMAGHNRAKLAWYSIDPIFYSYRSPDEINSDEISKNATRRIYVDEIFPELDLYQGESRAQTTFDISFYPSEKGPYNNNTLNNFLNNKKENWAAITKTINTTNFKKANVEYIQFWMLDDFSEYDSNDFQIGEIVFHLGNISEDILPDGKKQYENGLPVKPSDNFDNSKWGKTPTSQSLVYAFNSDADQRKSQDLGYDGLNDIDEKEYYFNGNTDDPAGDNYEYYLKREGSILNRYKNYNGSQGNSPVNIDSNNRGSTTLPDVEDVNNDNTMNRINSYFEYKIPILKNITKENHPFVSDIRENNNVKLSNGNITKSRWIQFKIPIFPEYYDTNRYSNFFNAVNGISDLKTIRFIRMAIRGFSSPVTMRFATLDLVKTDWKRYNLPLNNDNIINSETNFEIGSVNILDNENKSPVNYVLPPGVEREEIINNNSIIRQNEQSLSLKIQDLKPMDSRAVYKNINIDLRNYKKIKMYLHAESLEGKELLPGDGVEDDYNQRLVAFLRLGSDINDNYYQIEVPLKPTTFSSGQSSRFSSEKVWNPNNNSIDFDLEKFLKIKLKLISEKIQSNDIIYFDEDLNIIDEFSPISKLPGEKKYKFSIKGNPSLGRVKTITLGLKNPSISIGNNLSGEAWFNELRLSEIKGKGGWSAVANLDANLADFANVSFSGRLSTDGFGSVDKSPNERNNENYSQYSLVTNLNAGQLLPENWGIQIPISYTSSKEISKPKYDSYYDDIQLNNILDIIQNKDSVINQSKVMSNSKSFSVLGLSKRKMNDKKSKIYDIENLNFSYSYSENKYQDFEMDYSNKKMVMANAQYSYNFENVSIYPFEKILENKDSKYLKWLKEFNFNPLPNSLTFSGNYNRTLFSQKFREVNYLGVVSNNQIPIPEFRQSKFMFDWLLSISHNLSKSLILSYNASNSSLIPSFTKNIDATDRNKMELFDNFFEVGESNFYNQNFSANYNLPISNFPFLDFIDANYSYNGNFNWQRGSDIQNNITDEFGNKLGRVNKIQNSNNQSFNISLNLDKLYRQISFLNKNSIFNLLKSVKRIRSTYSENSGKVLPGYIPSIGFLGTLKPSFGFVFGDQKDVRYEIAKNGWLTEFSNFNQQYQKIYNSKFDLSAEIELFKNLRIDLNANRTYSNNYSENYSIIENQYNSLNGNFYGNFSISSNMLRTSFDSKSVDVSDNFENLKNIRLDIANRLISNKNLNDIDYDNDGFPIGYGKNSQAVLIPAFISAYTGIDVTKISLNPITDRPKLNWTLQYTGLEQFFDEIFSRVSLQHGYRSNFTINNFNYNLNFQENGFDLSGNYLNKIIFSNVNLVEQFNPLIRLDLELKNSLRIIFDVIKDRAISLSLANNLVTESWGNEYSLGMGYRVKNLKLRSNLASNGNNFIGDLNAKVDLNLRKNITVIRNLDVDDNKVSAGQSIFSLKLSADYALSRNFSAILFYDHLFSKYEISTAFPQTNIRSGFTFRYSFGN